MSTEIEQNPHVALNNAREEERHFMPIDCEKCGATHNLHGDCVAKLPTPGNPIVLGRWPKPETFESESGPARTIQLPGTPQFNSLHISRLAVKVDGHTEHVFIAILNGSAAGQVIAKHAYDQTSTRAWNLRMLYVTPVHRHKGVATRLFQAVEQFARREKATQLELCCLKANTAGRAFWIRRGKFIDDPEREAGGERSAEYVTMVKEL